MAIPAWVRVGKAFFFVLFFFLRRVEGGCWRQFALLASQCGRIKLWNVRFIQWDWCGKPGRETSERDSMPVVPATRTGQLSKEEPRIFFLFFSFLPRVSIPGINCSSRGCNIT